MRKIVHIPRFWGYKTKTKTAVGLDIGEDHFPFNGAAKRENIYVSQQMCIFILYNIKAKTAT